MGFRVGAFAKVWKVEPVSDTMTKLRISTSFKNKKTGEYEQDFSGFVCAVGTAAAKKAAILKEGCKIKLGDVDVKNKYDSEKQTTYTNHLVFSFELDTPQEVKETPAEHKQSAVDSGEVDDSRLPF